MSERVMIFSSDCHGGPATADYRPYLEERFHDDLDQFLSEKSVMAHLGTAGRNPEQNDGIHRTTFATNFESRLGFLEADGIVGEVIFPDGTRGNELPFTGYFGGPGHFSVEHDAVAMRAYYRWLGEHCDPGRQIGLALIPLHNPEYAAEQAREARGLGLSGIFPEFEGTDQAHPLYDRALDPLWGACVDNGLTVNFHSGSGIPSRIYNSPEGQNVFEFKKYLWPRRCLSHMILGGVLERFPELKVGFTELLCAWIAPLLELLDDRWEHGGAPGTGRAFMTVVSREVCPLRPREYFHRQCFVGASALSRNELEMRDEIGKDVMMFGTDHSHFLSTWKNTIPYLQMTFGAAGVSEGDTRAILGENIARLYDLNYAKLSDIADRVGPTISEILTKPTDATPQHIPEYLRKHLVGFANRATDT